MVVISATICTKEGKILMSRQFVKINVEELIANFPKLIEPGKKFNLKALSVLILRRIVFDTCIYLLKSCI